jgi:hypothetical protein
LFVLVAGRRSPTPAIRKPVFSAAVSAAPLDSVEPFTAK